MKQVFLFLVCILCPVLLNAQNKLPADKITEYVALHGVNNGKIGNWDIYFIPVSTSVSSPDIHVYAVAAKFQTSSTSILAAGYAMTVSTSRGLDEQELGHATVTIEVHGPKIETIERKSP